MSASDTSGTVLLTGFGPFGNVQVNASWEVVRTLVQQQPELGVDGRKYLLRAPEDPVTVSYRAVDEAAAAGNCYGVESERPPCMIIHVGVGHRDAVHLETQACNEGYRMPDCTGALHCAGGVCVADAPPLLRTRLDVSRLAGSADAVGNVKVAASANAGRYLCEYIFYKSLQFSEARRTGGRLSAGPDVLFVHVPPLGEPYPLEALASTLQRVVEGCLSQLHERAASVDELASLIAGSREDAEVLLCAHGTADAAAEAYVNAPETAVSVACSKLGTSQLRAAGPGQGDAFAEALFSLANLGFRDEAAARAALEASGGDLQQAALALAASESTTEAPQRSAPA